MEHRGWLAMEMQPAAGRDAVRNLSCGSDVRFEGAELRHDRLELAFAGAQLTGHAKAIVDPAELDDQCSPATNAMRRPPPA
jgi:hypothetical protein